MNLKFSFAILMLALLPAFAVATTCTGGLTSVSTPAGATVLGEAVDASASFCATAGQVVITLTNLQTGIVDAGQLLTDLQFSMNTADTSATLSSSSANFILIGSGGAVTPDGSGATGWGFGSGTLGTGNYLLCIICGDGVTATAQPTEGIIGPGPYTSANGSIANNPAHNPFIDQTGTFTISDSHITSNTNFSGVVFSFTTTFGNNIIPEPRTYAPLILAFGLIVLAVHRRRARSARA
ncbi:MAG TPA: hypothetical protein VEV17_15865 [Bryobacteraceae bacterium]|nr:hypothetical protein [Bryobacteraceae bacterium]